MAIPQGYRTNFETLKQACKNGDLALMECQDKKTKAQVMAVCAVNWDGKEFTFVPLAKMFDGNPYEELSPPDPNSPTGFCEE